ncbi:Chemotaxis protein methyltransferase CheR [Rhodovulum sp. PH10]|uniref:sensor histidine kinase n=1 Tax=Rhodovulum sp. PH10 TaxID=1187851 RepID=UPI00027C2A1E|nr:HWE histidine kinase domain-containing protein [Rhodovulum sp. PH10]EJW12228.1 Chemotaxis protein methyltransferase CheR [Rhodovulum sp. PH10]
MPGKLKSWKDMLDVLPVPAYLCDEAGAIVHCNRRAAELWGRSPIVAEDALDPWHTYASREGHRLSLTDTPVGDFMRNAAGSVRDCEIVIERFDGGRAIALANIEPITDEDGALIGAVGCFQDITDRKRADHQQRTLLNELNHRVKNTLATVQSFADHTIRTCGLPKGAQDDFEGRLIALSRAHDQLSRGRWEPIDLKSLIESAVAPYLKAADGRIELRGDAIRLGAQSSLTLAMIFHELASNAAKYGALSNEAGRLSVSWSVSNGYRPPTLVLHWTESDGPPVAKPAHLGFGSRLVQQGVSRQLRGMATLDYDPSGLRCTMDIPLSSTPG